MFEIRKLTTGKKIRWCFNNNFATSPNIIAIDSENFL